MASKKQERVTLSEELVEKLEEFLTKTTHGKKIALPDTTKNVEFILRDYIKEHS